MDRASRWITDLFSPSDPLALVRWASLSIPLAAVWRTYRPGTKHDELVILAGPQGCGKSTALRSLLPPEPVTWFSDTLDLGGRTKERAEALQGRVIVEAAELAGVTRADIHVDPPHRSPPP